MGGAQHLHDHAPGDAGVDRPRTPPAPRPVGRAAPILQLQRTAGNQAVNRLLDERRPTVQRAGENMAAALQARAEQQIEAEKAARAERKGAEGGKGEGDERPAPPSPDAVAAEKARQRRAMAGAVSPPDTSGARSEAAGNAGAAKAEAAQPTTPIAGGKSAPDTGAVRGSSADAAGAAGEAGQAGQAGQAAQAAALAAAETPPPEPVAIEPPPVLQTLDAGGREIPADPVMEAGIAAVAGRLQMLRSGAQQVRSVAAAERAQGHRLEGLIQGGRSGVTDAEAGITGLKAHTAQRRGAVGQAKSALEVSQQKAQTVASGAPQVTAKSEEGAEKSTPMATESRSLAAENTSHTPEDSEAAGKSAEQGAKLSKVGSDMGAIDSTIGQTKARAQGLAQEAAQAAQANTATQGRIAETEQTIAQTEAKTEQLTDQTAAARSRLDGLAAEPVAHRASADELDQLGGALHAASAQLEARLRAAQQTYISGMASTPPPMPDLRGPAVQRASYEGRAQVDPAHAVTSALPSWVTGEEPANAAAAVQHKTQEDARRAAEIAEIEREAGGHFEQLTASQKAGMAMRLSGRNLWRDIGDVNLPRFGLTLLRGFVDPRVSLMGIVQGFGQIATGAANLFSAEQWGRDPLGNALKSSADIATGVTIVLGSIAGLAVAIGIILTAVAIVGSIFSFGAVGLALAPIIAFCGTVAATVGPWALWAAGVALVLHALVFIKNLIDAATASTAAQLQQSSDRMTEDAKNAGAMALQIGMAKAMEAGGKLLAGRGGGAAGEAGGAGAASEGAPAPETAPAAAPEGVPAPEVAPAPEGKPAAAPGPEAATPTAPETPQPAEIAPAEGAPPRSELPPDFDGADLDFKPESLGPLVEIPTTLEGTPAKVLELGSGPTDTNLGLPPEPGQGNPAVVDPSLIDLTRSDLHPRPGVIEVNATEPIPSGLRGQDTVTINNPRGYAVDIANVGEAVRPGGRIIIQGRAEVVKGMRGTNPDMTRVLRDVQAGRVPSGYRVVEVVTDPTVRAGPPTAANRPPDVMGGPFNRTAGDGPVSWPNTRIVIEKLPPEPTAPSGGSH